MRLRIVLVLIPVLIVVPACTADSAKSRLVSQLSGADAEVTIDFDVVRSDWDTLVLACGPVSASSISDEAGFEFPESVPDGEQVLIFSAEQELVEAIMFSPGDHISWCVSAIDGRNPSPVEASRRVDLHVRLQQLDAQDTLSGASPYWVATDPFGQ